MKSQPINEAPRRPVLRWHGAKWMISPWIIRHFPEHHVYVEPYGGSGSVLLRKPRSYGEIWNDLDDDVVNMFRVMRSNRAAELVDAIRLTPYSRIEFAEAIAIASDPVERARRLVIRCFMGFGSNGHSRQRNTGFRANSTRSGTSPGQQWMTYPDSLMAAIERLSGAVIEHRDAQQVMQTHDSDRTLHYVDPPYMLTTRSDCIKDYEHEMSNEDHGSLLEFLKTLRGTVILSGYASALYDSALSEWQRVERHGPCDGAKRRTEVLWIKSI